MKIDIKHICVKQKSEMWGQSESELNVCGEWKMSDWMICNNIKDERQSANASEEGAVKM